MSPRPDDRKSQRLPPVPPELADLLGAATSPAWQATDEFRESLCSYVSALKVNGVPPERMLTTVKRLLGSAPASLTEQAVKWCIEAYFRPG